MASAVDPEHGYRWLQWHSVTPAEQEGLKTKLFGELHTMLDSCRRTVSTRGVKNFSPPNLFQH